MRKLIDGIEGKQGRGKPRKQIEINNNEEQEQPKTEKKKFHY